VEENSKLCEFPADSGCIVDVLQGEISVICEDVKSLKERFDKGLGVSSSSFLCPKLSNDTYCVLSSLNLSLKRTSTSKRSGASQSYELVESMVKKEAATAPSQPFRPCCKFPAKVPQYGDDDLIKEGLTGK
jgi:hypothetical protein